MAGVRHQPGPSLQSDHTTYPGGTDVSPTMGGTGVLEGKAVGPEGELAGSGSGVLLGKLEEVKEGWCW
jgi:hypothetical protein